MRITHIEIGGVYKPGDMPPEGYVNWHEWAEVQHKAGLRQNWCGRCSLCWFPQEMSDLFHESVPFEFIDRVFDVIWKNHEHTFQILTKRPERMVQYIKERASELSFGRTDIERTPFRPGDFIHFDDVVMRNQCGYHTGRRESDGSDDAFYICEHPKNESCGKGDSCHRYECPIFYPVSDRKSLKKIGVEDEYEFDDEGFTDDSEWMELHDRPLHALPSNVWLGFSAENQKTFEERSRIFRPLRWITPYLTLFCSAEPLLGPINTRVTYYEDSETENWSPLDKHEFSRGGDRWKVPYLDWVIIGCESGPKRRPMKQEWAESLLDQCQAAGVACFIKQMEIDGMVTGDISKFPERLRVRQFPKSFKEQAQ